MLLLLLLLLLLLSLQCVGFDYDFDFLQCECLDPKPKPPEPKCADVTYKGDGICDDANNNAGCEYDGGDCCEKSVGGPVKKDYCKQCKCLDPNPKLKCVNVAYKGDGVCDDGNNNVGCEFDGGESLITRVMSNQIYCCMLYYCNYICLIELSFSGYQTQVRHERRETCSLLH